MGYKIIDTFDEKRLNELHLLFKKEWWTQNRKLADLKNMVEHSTIAIGLIDEDTGELTGFGRVLTDTVYRAFIFDIITKESARNKGIGKLLLHNIMEHPLVRNTERVELYCLEEMIPYYEKFGFTAATEGSRLMRIQRRNRQETEHD